MIVEISLLAEVVLDADLFSAEMNHRYPEFKHFKILRKSIDARGKQVKFNLKIECSHDGTFESHSGQYTYKMVSDGQPVNIVGAGPAGLFAALRLIELGLKPVVFERGKDVKERRRDLAAINKEHIVNPDSNYCFGEGGAGTYSDGKLYTRSKKRGEISRILEILVNHGAHEDIRVDAHPHIGTNKLPQVVEALRKTILDFGGEVYFNTRVSDFVIQNHQIAGVSTSDGQVFLAKATLLATGHSARDIFEICFKNQVKIEAKPFALGVRIEHPQGFIDACQYHRKERGLLPPAAYSLVTQTNYKGLQRGVFSFCMCPGGFIVPSATDNEELVVNGMSPSRRDSKFANSGLVVAINEPDWQQYSDFGPLAALEFQKNAEKLSWHAGKRTTEKALRGLDKSVSTEYYSQLAPAQKVGDFLAGKTSKTLNETSYIPGLTEVNMLDALPDVVGQSLRMGLGDFEKKMRGYGSNLGQLIGVESRTSSPVRIPRNPETLEHVEISGLYPCGEGAGYAGGIVSAAMDGERCAERIFEAINKL